MMGQDRGWLHVDQQGTEMRKHDSGLLPWEAQATEDDPQVQETAAQVWKLWEKGRNQTSLTT